MSASPKLHYSLLEHGFRSDLFEMGEVVVVGVSGGADSMVMLELLARLVGPRELKLRAVHVNYGLRGEASRLDEWLVRRRCRELNIYLVVHRASELSVTDSNLEERAREIRQDVLRAEAREFGASAIALGHTQDDQAENILLRLIRGSGLQGLSAMRGRDGLIVRPLLKVRRAALREYAEERAIAYRDDQSNLDLRFTRNRVRHQLLPLLQENFNPNIIDTLVQSAGLVGEDEQFLVELTETIYRRFVKEKDGQILISSVELMDLPLALQRRLVRAMVRAAAPVRTKIGHAKAVDLALAALQKDQSGVVFPLGEGLTLSRKKGSVSVTLHATN